VGLAQSYVFSDGAVLKKQFKIITSNFSTELRTSLSYCSESHYILDIVA